MFTLIAKASTESGMAAGMVKYGIPGLLVFAAGILLPMAVKQLRRLGAMGKVILVSVWGLILGGAVVWIVAQARTEFSKRYVVDGTATGVDDPDRLEFDDLTIYERRSKDEDTGRTEYRWALVAPHPIQGRPIRVKVVGPDNLEKAAFEAMVTTGDETFEWEYDGQKREMLQLNPVGPEKLKHASVQNPVTPNEQRAALDAR